MRFIIIGAGEIGYHVAQRLSLENQDVTIIEKNLERTKKLQDSLDVQLVHASGSSPSALRQAGIENADMLIAATDSDEVNVVSCLVANAQTKIPTKIARIRNLEYIYDPLLLQKDNLSIDLIINPEFEAVTSILSLLQVPGATDVIDFGQGQIRLIGLRVRNSIFAKGISLKDLRRMSQIENMVIVSVYRDGKVIIPRGNDKVLQNDSIYVITTPQNIRNMLAFFGSDYQEVNKVMIVGGSSIGVLLAKEFEKMKISIKLIESDELRCQKIAEELDKTIILHHGGEIEEILSEEYIGGTDIFIAATDDEEDNILLSLLAKQQGAKKAIALIHNMTYTKIVANIGVDLVINPNLSAVNRILQFVRKGKVLSVASFYEKNAEAIEAVALETSDLVRTPLKNLKLPKDAVIGAIMRGNELIVPYGESVIMPGDHVVIFALTNAVPRIEKMLMVKLEYW